MHDIVTLAELLRSAQPCVVLTGAGVSTESGVPDFRSAGGIWATYDPAEVASIDGFQRDPTRVWEFYGRRLALLREVQPNTTHVVLAELEAAGLVRAVVTQNVDGLHARAGSRELIEVHGSLATAVCPACGESVAAEEIRLPVPRCPVCGTVLKPNVVMFGELLPRAALAAALALAGSAGVLLVVGSSLQVWPVAGLPEETLRRGGRVAVVNREPTPYDDRATVVIHADAGPVFEELRLVLLGERADRVDAHRQPDARLERLEEL
ncbi:MAG TPA: NAD-dependent deacylase [Acidimicrobiales bacterium]|nr:NAD-dependent deacylase [Acidimicrobiales bacterium]